MSKDNIMETSGISTNPFARPVVEKPAPVIEKVSRSTNEYSYSRMPSVTRSTRTVNKQPSVVRVYPKEKTEVINMEKKREVIFYYGFYSVMHPFRKGEVMEPLHSITGETRKCPCNSIAIKLDNVILLAENGYRLRNLDDSLFRGRTITKKNIEQYVTYITNMINNGFLRIS